MVSIRPRPRGRRKPHSFAAAITSATFLPRSDHGGMCGKSAGGHWPYLFLKMTEAILKVPFLFFAVARQANHVPILSPWSASACSPRSASVSSAFRGRTGGDSKMDFGGRDGFLPHFGH
jgi:hypothetical protein